MKRSELFLFVSRNSGEHVPVKRLVQAATPAAGRPSRSPIKARPQEESSTSTKLDIASDKSSFLLLEQVGIQGQVLLVMLPQLDVLCTVQSRRLPVIHCVLRA